MLADRIRTGLPIGLIGGAATAGALMGLGLRHRAATLPFELGGRSLLASWRIASPPDTVALVAGIVAHLVWMLLWGLCFSVAASRLRGTTLAAGALLFVLFLGALAATVVPGALGAVAFAALTSAQSAFFLLLLAGAFIAGVVLTRTDS